MTGKGKSRSGKDSKESKSGSSPNISSSQKTPASSSSSRPKRQKDESPSRIPPRSRTGCWTCRRRKVKCDEKRPVCTQCARLGEECDYDPRLKFLSETDKMIGAMQSVSMEGCPAWDSSPQPQPLGWEPTFGDYDDMPPFAALANDEDRERKAAFQAPGTYNTVLVPGSFAGASQDRSTSRGSRSGGRHSSPATPHPAMTSAYRPPSTNADQDPTVVVLDRFEEPRERRSGENAPFQPGNLQVPNTQTYYPLNTSLPYTEHYYPQYHSAPPAIETSYYDEYAAMSSAGQYPPTSYYEDLRLNMLPHTGDSYAAYGAGQTFDIPSRGTYHLESSGSLLQQIAGYEQYMDPALEQDEQSNPRDYQAPPKKRHHEQQRRRK